MRSGKLGGKVTAGGPRDEGHRRKRVCQFLAVVWCVADRGCMPESSGCGAEQS